MASTTDASSETALADEDKKPRCRLLELPEELQLDIYELVVISQKAIKLTDVNCDGYGDDRCLSYHKDQQWRCGLVQPEISKTCRSLRSMVLPVYYKRNVFEFCYCRLEHEDFIHGVKHWLDEIGASNRALLANFRYHEWDQVERGHLQPSAGSTRSLPKALQSFGPHISTLESQHINSFKFHRYQLSFTQ
ncbi:hypothetical protein LTR17_010803 [Elasticomyces elasticus]|nr:hypothetical protein LTR17_010803 [Elasticomyces elasticus]